MASGAVADDNAESRSQSIPGRRRPREESPKPMRLSKRMSTHSARVKAALLGVQSGVDTLQQQLNCIQSQFKCVQQQFNLLEQQIAQLQEAQEAEEEELMEEGGNEDYWFGEDDEEYAGSFFGEDDGDGEVEEGRVLGCTGACSCLKEIGSGKDGESEEGGKEAPAEEVRGQNVQVGSSCCRV